MSKAELSIIFTVDEGLTSVKPKIKALLQRAEDIKFDIEVILITKDPIPPGELSQSKVKNVIKANTRGWPTAVEIAAGEYCFFGNSADLVDISALKRVLQDIEKIKPEIVVCLHSLLIGEKNIWQSRPYFDALTLRRLENIPAIIHDTTVFAKLFKVQQLKNIFVDLNDIGELIEVEVVWETYLRADGICLSSENVYGHKIDPIEVSKKAEYWHESLVAWIALVKKYKEKFQKNGLEDTFLEKLLNLEIPEILQNYMNSNASHESSKQGLEQLQEWLASELSHLRGRSNGFLSDQSKQVILKVYPGLAPLLSVPASAAPVVEKYEFSNQWFSVAKNIWDQILPTIKPARVLEIGSYEGAASTYLVELIAQFGGGELFCVDTWEGGIEHQIGGAAEADMSEVEARFMKNMAIALRRARNVKLEKIKAYSDFALSTLIAEGKSEYFDFIYVDGSHQAPDVLLDAVLSFKLLRVGGIIAFDDYLWAEPLSTGVDPIRCPKPAIDAFSNIFCRKINVLSAPLYQLYVQKISH